MSFVHLARVSSNVKTGAIPVSTSSKATCPDTCKLKDNGCYASNFPLSVHWSKVTAGERGVPYDEFLLQIRALPKNQLWRHSQAGDLQGQDGVIDAQALLDLTRANVGRRGFTFTHYPPTPENAQVVKWANQCGFSINWSADSLDQADEYLALKAGPVVVIVPPGWKGATPAGNRVTRCPAQFVPDMTCAVCQLCANPNRRAIVSFEAHGARKGSVMKTFQLKLEM